MNICKSINGCTNVRNQRIHNILFYNIEQVLIVICMLVFGSCFCLHSTSIVSLYWFCILFLFILCLPKAMSRRRAQERLENPIYPNSSLTDFNSSGRRLGTDIIQQMQEMVSDWSSRAEKLTNLCEISMRVFFDSNKCGKWQYIFVCLFFYDFLVFREKIFEKLQGPYQSCKKAKIECS